MKRMRKWKKVIMVMAVVVMAMAMSMTSSAASAKKTGFVKKAGKVYYYKKGKKVTGVVKINNKYYGFDKKGVRYKQGWQKIKGKRYFFNKYGVAATGLKKAWSEDSQGQRYPGYYLFSDKGVQYRRPRGKYCVKYKGKTVYMDFDDSVRDGSLLITPEDVDTEKKVYVVLNPDGTLRKPGWYQATNQSTGGWCYYVLEKGIAMQDKFAKVGNRYVYFGAGGKVSRIFKSEEELRRALFSIYYGWTEEGEAKIAAIIANLLVLPEPDFELRTTCFN